MSAMRLAPAFAPRHPQAGMTLVVVLLLMATLAVGGLYTARSALMGERLARNQLDLSVAKQAAEAALRDGEKDLMLAGGTKPTGAVCDRGSAARPVVSHLALFSTCKAGQCDTLSEANRLAADYTQGGTGGSTAEVWWPVAKGGLWGSDTSTKPLVGGATKCGTFTGGVPLGTYTGASAILGVSQQPEYLLELVRKGQDTVFRITARGFGQRSGTEVVLQSYFRVPDEL